MDSYVEPLPRPLYLPPPQTAAATHINQEGGTSCRSPPPLRKETEGEAWSRQLLISPAYTFHGTLRMSCLSCADNSLGLLWRSSGEISRGASTRWKNADKSVRLSITHLLDDEVLSASTMQLGFGPVQKFSPNILKQVAATGTLASIALRLWSRYLISTGLVHLHTVCSSLKECNINYTLISL